MGVNSFEGYREPIKSNNLIKDVNYRLGEGFKDDFHFFYFIFEYV